MAKSLSHEEFMHAAGRCKSIPELAEATGMREPAIYSRLNRLRRIGVEFAHFPGRKSPRMTPERAEELRDLGRRINQQAVGGR